MVFTKDEFNIMIDELLYKEPISFEMLCHIAGKTLKSKMSYWCSVEECLCGRGYEDDIMQNVYLLLMQKTVTHFLLKDGVDGPVNNDPEGFKSWLFTVAENAKKDFANKIRNRDFKTEDIEKPEIGEIPGKGIELPELGEGAEHVERLKKAFHLVVIADTSIYKKLTWIAQFVFMVGMNVTKIQSNDILVRVFSDKTLNEMYEVVVVASKLIPWMDITEEEDERIKKSLRKTDKDGIIYGEMKYKDFFMKTNGIRNGKKSISDWVNRINDNVRPKVS